MKKKSTKELLQKYKNLEEGILKESIRDYKWRENEKIRKRNEKGEKEENIIIFGVMGLVILVIVLIGYFDGF